MHDTWWIALAVGLAACTNSGVQQAGSARDPATPAHCVYVWGEARYRNYGYDHIVHLKNTCAGPAECDVASDVNPTPTRVRLQRDEHREVLTFRGSPAREFVPRVTCWVEKTE